MVIGDPIDHSLSPQMHNAGYKAVGIDDQFVYVACHVKITDIEALIQGIKALGIHGISCTIPHKRAVMPYLDSIDETAKKIGAVNTIVNNNGILQGYNTDWLGVITPLEQITSLKNKTVALLGAGGAARAVAFGVTKQGARLTIFNRTKEKAQSLAKEFHAEAFSLDQIQKIRTVDIIINTTSVGLHSHENETPVPKKYLNNKQIVFDAVYGKKDTRLITEAKQQGAQTITGKAMLFYQGLAQFKLFTGYDAPEEAIKQVFV